MHLQTKQMVFVLSMTLSYVLIVMIYVSFFFFLLYFWTFCSFCSPKQKQKTTKNRLFWMFTTNKVWERTKILKELHILIGTFIIAMPFKMHITHAKMYLYVRFIITNLGFIQVIIHLQQTRFFLCFFFVVCLFFFFEFFWNVFWQNLKFLEWFLWHTNI